MASGAISSRASFAMASGATSAGGFGTLLWDASNIRIQRRVAQHGGIGQIFLAGLKRKARAEARERERKRERER